MNNERLIDTLEQVRGMMIDVSNESDIQKKKRHNILDYIFGETTMRVLDNACKSFVGDEQEFSEIAITVGKIYGDPPFVVPLDKAIVEMVHIDNDGFVYTDYADRELLLRLDLERSGDDTILVGYYEGKKTDDINSMVSFDLVEDEIMLSLDDVMLKSVSAGSIDDITRLRDLILKMCEYTYVNTSGEKFKDTLNYILANIKSDYIDYENARHDYCFCLTDEITHLDNAQGSFIISRQGEFCNEFQVVFEKFKNENQGIEFLELVEKKSEIPNWSVCVNLQYREMDIYLENGINLVHYYPYDSMRCRANNIFSILRNIKSIEVNDPDYVTELLGVMQYCMLHTAIPVDADNRLITLKTIDGDYVNVNFLTIMNDCSFYFVAIKGDDDVTTYTVSHTAMKNGVCNEICVSKLSYEEANMLNPHDISGALYYAGEELCLDIDFYDKVFTPDRIIINSGRIKEMITDFVLDYSYSDGEEFKRYQDYDNVYNVLSVLFSNVSVPYDDSKILESVAYVDNKPITSVSDSVYITKDGSTFLLLNKNNKFIEMATFDDNEGYYTFGPELDNLYQYSLSIVIDTRDLTRLQVSV